MGHASDIPWLDRPESLERLEGNPEFQSFDPTLQDKIRSFVQDGYLILEGFYSEADTQALNAEVESLLASGKAGYNFTGRKIFNLWETSRLADEQF